MSDLLDEIPKEIPTFSRRINVGTTSWDILQSIKAEIDKHLKENNIQLEIYQMLFDFDDGMMIFKCRKNKEIT